MTPNEYRKKHKRCGTCKHWTEPVLGYEHSGVCDVKKSDKYNTEGRFCRIYKAKEYRE